MSKPDRATVERNSRTLRELVKRPENKVCSDCKRNGACSCAFDALESIAGMGTHISKVKSVDLDVWTPEQMDSIQKWGNKRANLYWEAHLEARAQGGSSAPAYEQAPAGPSHQQQQLAAAAPPPISTPTSSRGPTTRQPQARHQLLSSAYTNRSAAAAPAPVAATPAPLAPVAPAPQAPAAPASAAQDLFSLDFHTPSPSSTPALGSQGQQPKKDVKNDIMALFSAAPASQPASAAAFGSFHSPSTAAWGASAPVQQQAVPPQAAQPTSMIGSGGVGAWGSSSGWGAPQVAQQPTFQPNTSNNVWGSPAAAPVPAQQASFFNTSDVWGSSSAAAQPAVNPSQDLFGGFASSATPAAPPKKDDVFGDIWGGFK
ncbi:Smap1 protein [Ephemerocybe angulata]|uniref:Smap1 protein n=1 Tax=Ephemerocybe angulata TaxID=980116 RepID=A0A8H6IK51_9AGAR|nr:Smap1 protein [Tulosesus angulatus]